MTADNEVTIDIEPMSDLLVALLGADRVREIDDDLLGAMAYGITLVRQAPVEQRMEAMGMKRCMRIPERHNGLWIEESHG